MKVFLILLLLISCSSWGRVIALKDYMFENPSLGENIAPYISLRCSAIFYHISEFNKDRDDLFKNLNKPQTQFSEMSLILTIKVLPDESEEKLYQKTSNTINDMIDEYIEVSNTHYKNTGSNLTDFMMNDIEIYSSIIR